MRRFTIGFVIFTVLCSTVFGQNWQDENMVWDEEKQEWVVSNRAHGRVNADEGEGEGAKVRIRPYDHLEWGRYLPVNVRYGKREPTEWELSEAKRKLWVKKVLTQRAMKEAEERKKLLAYRRATGWYGARYNAGIQHGGKAYNLHMNSIRAYRGY